ncbi:MAG: hypothetical protein DMG11_15490 [Acidobacteria bacterium]|nr:MAG: hypothetical protein DMG11_15490 [Acidobacteriota bacterium]
MTPQLTLQPTINDLAATPPGLSQAVVPFLGGPFTLVVNGQNLQGGVVSVDAVGVGTGFVAAFPTELSADITTDILSSPGARGVSVTKPGSLISNIVNLNVVRHGDVNSNGSVTIADALVTALTVGGIVKPPLPMSIGDVNLNASANIGDALEIALLAGRMKADWDVPQVSSVSPAPAMRGNTLTITGTGFAATPSDNLVFFTVPNNGAVRVIPTAGTVTTLTVMVPNDALSGPMQVYRRDVPLGGREFPLIVAGTTISLALTRVNPYFQVQVGATVTLEGMGFDATPGNNTVLFKSATGTIAAVVTAASTTSLTVTVPPGAVCGPVTVVTPSLQTSNQRMVTISGTSCGVQLADIWGAGSSGDTLVLEGAGFDVVNPGNNGVRFASSAGGTVTAPVLAAGGTQLHVRVPDTAIEGNVTVTVGSTTSNAVLYRTPPRMTPSSVAVVISGPEALGSYQVTIGFNKNIVTVNPANVKGGTGAGFTGNPTTVNVDNNMGVVTINHFQVGNSPTGLFTVANITFTPVAVGTTNLSLFGISLTDTSGGNLPNRLSLSSPTVTVLRVP